MTTVRTFTRAFSSGEVTSELFGRFDLTKVAQACATLRNFVALPHGPAQNRPGFEFCKEVKDSTKKTRLIPFSYNADQTFAIELGAGWIRFHTRDPSTGAPATLLAGPGGIAPTWTPGGPYAVGDVVNVSGTNYYCTFANVNMLFVVGNWYAMPADGTLEVPNGYAEADLFNIHYTQSADVMTLVHPSYDVQELQRHSATSWTITAVSFVSKIAVPTSPTANAVGAGGVDDETYTYCCTAVGADGQESAPSVSVSVDNSLFLAGKKNLIYAGVAADVIRVNWYKLAFGIFGYIGTAAISGAFSVTFIDDNIAADVSLNPPSFDPAFAAGSPVRPSAVGYFEQRRWFAGWNAGPQNVVATRSGTESDVTYHIPARSDDRIAFRIAAREGSTVQHIIPAQNLILLSATNEFRVQSVDGGALSGLNLSVRPQGYAGASNVQPVVVGSSVVYAQSRGGRIREMAYSQTAQGNYYSTNDLSMLAPHLFDYKTVVDMCFAHSPYPILWCVNDGGELLGMTYVPEQAVAGWHRHDTDGAFESCCTITENGEDALYVIVKRTIGGVAKRYVERLHTRKLPTQSDAFFVDCGLTYSGAPTAVISGLSHLEGKTVSMLGDGAVLPTRVVAGGAVTLPYACAKVSVGLAYTSDLQTLPMVIGMPDFGQGRSRNLNQVTLRVRDTYGPSVGPSFNKLVPLKSPVPMVFGDPPPWIDDEITVKPFASWDNTGQVCIRQTDPLPVTVVAATLEVSLGG